MAKLNVNILPAQAEMIQYDKRWGAARGGNRAGKSVGWTYWLLVKRIKPYPFANHYVIGADYDQLRRGYFDLLIGILDKLGWEEGKDYHYREHGRPKLTFLRYGKADGRECALQALSTKIVQRMKGMAIQTMVLEEPQTWGSKSIPGNVLFDILVTRLSPSVDSQERYPDLEPQARMSFNPPAEGHWLHDLIENKWKKADYKCWRMSARDNVLLDGHEEYIKDQEINLPPQQHASQIDGHWSTVGGGFYYAFDSKVHGNPPEGIPSVDWVDPTRPILWTHDFNVHKMCSVIAQDWENTTVPDWQPKVIRALDELIVRGAPGSKGGVGIPDVVRAFLASPWYELALEQGLEIYGDPAGGSRAQLADSRGSARTVYETMLQLLRDAGLSPRLKTKRVHPTLKISWDDVNAQFLTGAGPGVTVNMELCRELVLDFQQVGWDTNGQTVDKDDAERTHAGDSWRYLVDYKRRPPVEASFAVAKNRR